MSWRLLLTSFLLVAGCDSPSSDGGATIDVRGTWRYRATQSAPALEIDGELRITEQTERFFTGTAALRETDVQGTQQTRAGALSGRVIGADVLDFDIFIDAQARRHVARMVGDSIGGTWSAAGAAGLSGPFSARKTP